ncbi:MAG: proline dehydrogenase family protein [Actinomycetota bacterium]
MLGRTLLWAADQPRIKRFVAHARLTRPVVERFVAGDTLDDAVRAIKELNARGIGGILDLLGEGVGGPEEAEAAAADYLSAIKRIETDRIDTTVSVKLTQLGLAFDKGNCIDHLRRLAAEAAAVQTCVEIDMEQAPHVVDTLDVYRVMHPDYPDMRIALQAYLRRTPVDLQTMAALKPKVRLVKGAYAEPESLAFQSRKEIDRQYAFLTDWLFERGTDPAIASHDGKLIEHARRAAEAAGAGKERFEIQMLYGVRRDLQQELARRGHRVRVYVPFGSAWYPYLTRRIAERPANLRFFLRALLHD